MTKKLYELTDEHRAQLKPWADRWIANALRTKPQTAIDRKKLRTALHGMYRATKLEPPKIEVFASGPISAAIAACIASAVWWLRENPSEHQKLFGRPLTETNLLVAARAAAEYVAHVAWCSSRSEDTAITTEAATDAATEAATRAATDAATEAATWAATRAATDAATWAATGALVVRFMILCCVRRPDGLLPRGRGCLRGRRPPAPVRHPRDPATRRAGLEGGPPARGGARGVAASGGLTNEASDEPLRPSTGTLLARAGPSDQEGGQGREGALHGVHPRGGGTGDDAGVDSTVYFVT